MPSVTSFTFAFVIRLSLQLEKLNAQSATRSAMAARAERRDEDEKDGRMVGLLSSQIRVFAVHLVVLKRDDRELLPVLPSVGRLFEQNHILRLGRSRWTEYL